METLIGLCKSKLSAVITPFTIPIRTLQGIGRPRALRGLPPWNAKTLAQKLEGENYKDPSVYYKVNIGLPQVVNSRTDIINERKAHLKKLKNDPELEKKARENKISLCLDDVTKEWNKESAPQHVKAAAEHYGIFQDLFGDAFFYPQVNLDVTFKNKESLVPVFRGNWVKPNQALSAPLLTYDAEPDSWWTVVATNPDGHLHEENAEYLHWFLGNIPGNDVSRGEIIANYIQPFPAQGTGFQRFVFILYKQLEKLNYSSLQIPPNEICLKSRTFKTYDFYRLHQEQLTPAGLVFCQVDWDNSVSHFFHTVLNMEEPVYEYDFDPFYYTKQKLYPIKQPFNLYMDRYRDPKQIAKEFLLKKLKNRHPFEPPQAPLKFPNAIPVVHDLDQRLYGRPPSWLRREKIKQRLGHGRINDY